MSKTDLDFKVGADLKQFRTAMGNIDHSLKRLSGGFGALGGVIGATFAVDIIRQFAAESIDLASKAEGVVTAFERLDDPSLLRRLREATGNTVDDLSLMQKAVQAKNFRIPMDTLAKGLEFAQRRAQETGQSVDYMVDSFVTGLGRKSVMILDNLGISAAELREEMAKGATMAEAVGTIMDNSFAEAGDRIVTTSMKIEQQKAAITNLKTEIGEKLLPVYEKFLDKTIEGLTTINILASDDVSMKQKAVAALSQYLTVTGKQNTTIGKLTESFGQYLLLEQKIEQQQKESALSTEDYLSAMKQYEEERSAAAREAEETLQAYQDKLNELIPTIRAASYEIQKMFEPSQGSSQGLAEALGFDDVDTTLETIDEVGESIDGFENEVFKSFEQINAERERLQQGFMMMGGVIQSAMSAALSPLEEGETRIGNFADVFVQELKRMLVQLAATAAAAAALAAIMSLVFGGAGAAGAKLFGKNGMSFGDLFGSTFSGMGGGFGFAGGASQGMQGGIPIYGVLSGQDILLSSDRANRNRTRQRGF